MCLVMYMWNSWAEDVPKDALRLATMWVYVCKADKFSARLVVLGNRAPPSEIPTSSPTPRSSVWKFLFAIGVKLGLWAGSLVFRPLRLPSKQRKGERVAACVCRTLDRRFRRHCTIRLVGRVRRRLLQTIRRGRLGPHLTMDGNGNDVGTRRPVHDTHQTM